VLNIRSFQLPFQSILDLEVTNAWLHFLKLFLIRVLELFSDLLTLDRQEISCLDLDLVFWYPFYCGDSLFELMPSRLLSAQQELYMTSCTRNPELLPLPASTWSTSDESHISSSSGSGSSSSVDEVHCPNHHNWPPRLVEHSRVGCNCDFACCYSDPVSEAKKSCWWTARQQNTHTLYCGGTTVRTSRLFPRMTSNCT